MPRGLLQTSFRPGCSGERARHLVRMPFSGDLPSPAGPRKAGQSTPDLRVQRLVGRSSFAGSAARVLAAAARTNYSAVAATISSGEEAIRIGWKGRMAATLFMAAAVSMFYCLMSMLVTPCSVERASTAIMATKSAATHSMIMPPISSLFPARISRTRS